MPAPRAGDDRDLAVEALLVRRADVIGFSGEYHVGEQEHGAKDREPRSRLTQNDALVPNLAQSFAEQRPRCPTASPLFQRRVNFRCATRFR